MFGRSKRKDPGPPMTPEQLRDANVAAESELIETSLLMATRNKPLVAPGTGGFDGRVVVARTDEGWHAVTVGLCSPDVPADSEGASGLGYELSMTVAPDAVSADDRAAGLPWVVGALSAIALMAQQGRRFGPGSRLQNSNPLDGDPASTRTNLLFTHDRLFRTVTVPSGGVIELLQLVPVDDAMLERAKVEGTDVVLAELTQADPQLTALLRP